MNIVLPATVRNRGFTLLELLVVLSVTLLLGKFALHGITEQTRKQHMGGLQKAFMSLLLSARNAAVARRV